jgi:SAM-dependent methyltransferase
MAAEWSDSIVRNLPAVRSLDFDRVADRYDATRGGERRGQVMAGVLGPHIVGTRVVEIGVGTGLVAVALQHHGFDVIGFDLSMPMISQAKARIGARVAVADAHDLPLANGSVDSLVVVWVLHLVADPLVVLHELARVIRSGGRAIIGVNGSVFHDESDDISVTMKGLEEVTGRRRATAHEVGETATRAGFRVLDIVNTPEEAFERTPSVTATLVEQRTWSSLFEVPQDVWDARVVPIIEALRALPDPDDPRPVVGHQEVLILERS